jgi:hypothetical protein
MTAYSFGSFIIVSKLAGQGEGARKVREAGQ